MKKLKLIKVKHLRKCNFPVDVYEDMLDQFEEDRKTDVSKFVTNDVRQTSEYESKLVEFLPKILSDFTIVGMRYLPNRVSFKFAIQAQSHEGEKRMVCIEMKRENRAWKIHQIIYGKSESETNKDIDSMRPLFC